MSGFLHKLVIPVHLCVWRRCNNAAPGMKLSYRPMLEVLELRTVPSVVYNNATDFSVANNPNGVWSYGYLARSASAETPDASTFTPYEQHGQISIPTTSGQTSVLDVWSEPGNTSGLSITYNPTTQVINQQAAGSIITYQPHEAVFHPGSLGEYSDYRFTTPVTGSYSLSAIFKSIDQHGGATKDIHVLVNGGELFNERLSGSYQSTNSLSTQLTLQLGDRVDFVVGWGTGPNNGYDATALEATLTLNQGLVTQYNNARDFSATANPNGVWSYGYLTPSTPPEAPDASTFTLYGANFELSVLNLWTSTSGTGASVVHNPTTLVINYQATGSIITFQPHEAAFHPGSHGEYSDYRFTTPIAGWYSLSAIFESIDQSGGAPKDVHVLDNGSELFSQILSGNYQTTQAYSGDLFLQQADQIDFVVGWGTGPTNGADSTALDATLNFNQAAATHLDVSIPSSSTAGAPFDVTVTALNSQGELAPGYTGTVHFSSSDPYPGALPSDYTFTAADHGTHTFPNVALYTAGDRTLTARDRAVGPISGSATIRVVSASANHLLIEAPPAAIAGSPFDVTVTALDPYGNTDTNYTGTVAFTSTGTAAEVVLPSAYSFTSTDAGMRTFPDGVTLLHAGNLTLTATDTADSSITASATVVVSAAPVDHFQIMAPRAAVSGVPFTLTVTALDPYGNTVTNYTGTVIFSSTDTDPGAILPASYTFQASDGGMRTFLDGVTLVTPGSQTITATDTASGISGSAAVTVVPGPVPPPGGGANGPSSSRAGAPRMSPGSAVSGPDVASVDRLFTLFDSNDSGLLAPPLAHFRRIAIKQRLRSFICLEDALPE